MNISHKLSVPALQQRCMTFLLTHAAGKPIKAMRIAELFEEEELYREASRFVLENLNGWTEQEMSSLSQDTLLKLEKRFVMIRCSLRGKSSSVRQEKLVPGEGVEARTNPNRKGIPMRASLIDSNGLTAEMRSVRPVPTLPRAPVCSKRSGGRLTMQSFVSVDSISSLRPYFISLPTCRAVSAIYGVPIPQNSRGRHSATQSDTSQLSNHG